MKLVLSTEKMDEIRNDIREEPSTSTHKIALWTDISTSTA